MSVSRINNLHLEHLVLPLSKVLQFIHQNEVDGWIIQLCPSDEGITGQLCLQVDSTVIFDTEDNGFPHTPQYLDRSGNGANSTESSGSNSQDHSSNPPPLPTQVDGQTITIGAETLRHHGGATEDYQMEETIYESGNARYVTRNRGFGNVVNNGRNFAFDSDEAQITSLPVVHSPAHDDDGTNDADVEGGLQSQTTEPDDLDETFSLLERRLSSATHSPSNHRSLDLRDEEFDHLVEEVFSRLKERLGSGSIQQPSEPSEPPTRREPDSHAENPPSQDREELPSATITRRGNTTIIRTTRPGSVVNVGTRYFGGSGDTMRIPDGVYRDENGRETVSIDSYGPKTV
ncbi:hypothetical protein VNI00_010859 [Paramarasmius palmivorus]|uniref:Uncharacterized protein n=1 Tax=Paramarasmius palmivorus TaxID=297713 RepID=A0AAW0CFS5_9AGAR